MSKTNKTGNNGGVSTKIVVIIAICALVFGGIIGIFIYEAVQGDKTAREDTVSDDRADELADGEVYDFEQAGYIKLGQYKGLMADVSVEEEDVYAAMIEEVEEAELKGDDTVTDGDLVNIDFTGKLDGKKLKDASGEDMYVWIGKGEYIDDFEKGIIGIEKGKKKTIDCTFPADYDDKELAGKTVQFTIRVYGKFSDKAAQELSDGAYKTVQEYYEYEKALELEENRESKGDLVWEDLKDNVEVNSAPEKMLATATEDVTKMYESFAELSGMTVEELLESFNMDENGLSEIANDTVIEVMIAKTIAAKEGITMDDEYYRQALMEMLGLEESDEGAGSVEEMEKEYKESMGSRPKDDMLIERVKDFVGENATEGDAGGEEELLLDE